MELGVCFLPCQFGDHCVVATVHADDDEKTDGGGDEGTDDEQDSTEECPGRTEVRLAVSDTRHGHTDCVDDDGVGSEADQNDFGDIPFPLCDEFLPTCRSLCVLLGCKVHVLLQVVLSSQERLGSIGWTWLAGHYR